MAISLKKNSGGVVLDKGLNHLALRLRWEEENIDIDIMAMVLTDGKANEDRDFVFYGNLQHPSGAIIHSGDSRKGGEEIINLTLKDVPEIKNEIVLSASIDNAVNRGQHFGKATSAVIELVDLDNDNLVITTYHPSHDLIGEVCARLVKISKENNRWKIDAIAEGLTGLEQLVLDAGLSLAD